MSQHDFDITTADANTGITYRAAVNAALQALASLSSGSSEPSTKYPYQLWADTANGVLKIRNGANNAWIELGPLTKGWKGETSEYDNGSSGSSKTINWNNGIYQKVTLSASCTFSFTAPSGIVGRLQLKVKYGGAYSITWPSSVKWVNNVTPTPTANSSYSDLFVFYWDGSYYWGAQLPAYAV